MTDVDGVVDGSWPSLGVEVAEGGGDLDGLVSAARPPFMGSAECWRFSCEGKTRQEKKKSY